MKKTINNIWTTEFVRDIKCHDTEQEKASSWLLQTRVYTHALTKYYNSNSKLFMKSQGQSLGLTYLLIC